MIKLVFGGVVRIKDVVEADVEAVEAAEDVEAVEAAEDVEAVEAAEEEKGDSNAISLTFQPGGRPLGLDVPLTTEARALIASFFTAEGRYYLPGRTLSTIRLCPAPWCILWLFVDFSPPPSRLEPGVYSYKAPLADPIGLIIATALAYWAENAGVDAVVEAYSDAWHRYCAVLNALRALKTQVAIYTGFYDSRYICFDEINIKQAPVDISRAGTPEFIAIKSRFIAPQVNDSTLNPKVMELVERVWKKGGVWQLKEARGEKYDKEIMEAIAMGLLTYSRYDATLRITENGIALLMPQERKKKVEEEEEFEDEF